MPLTLRPSTDADLPAVTAIYGHHVTHGTGTFDCDGNEAADRLHALGRQISTYDR